MEEGGREITRNLLYRQLLPFDIFASRVINIGHNKRHPITGMPFIEEEVKTAYEQSRLAVITVGSY